METSLNPNEALGVGCPSVLIGRLGEASVIFAATGNLKKARAVCSNPQQEKRNDEAMFEIRGESPWKSEGVSLEIRGGLPSYLWTTLKALPLDLVLKKA